MLWVTRAGLGVNRSATGWLIRRFLDPEARFCFVAPAQVARVQAVQGAIGFDAPGARYPRQDGMGQCSFAALVEEHRPDDESLRSLAQIIQSAALFPLARTGRGLASRAGLGTFDRVSLAGWSSIPPEPPEAAGLGAIIQGLPLLTPDDEEILERGGFLYDALYATLQQRLR